MEMKLKMWHWRDALCWAKSRWSKNGYSVREFCGKCEKCNGFFGYCGVIPCPARFKEKMTPPKEHDPELEDIRA